MARRLLTALVAGLLLGLLGTAPASAHDVLEGSDPPNGATVAASPVRVSLDFDDTVQAGLSTLTVVGPGGTHWEQGRAVETGDSVSIGVSRLGPAGRYQVGYRIVSADGHPVSGETTFVLATAQGGTPDAGPTGGAVIPTSGPAGPAATASTPQPPSGGVPAWPFVVVAVVVLGGAVVFALRRTA